MRVSLPSSGLLLVLTAALVGCGESGACVQTVFTGNTKDVFCVEVENAIDCPVNETIDDTWRWEFREAKSCPDAGFTEACGDALFRVEEEHHLCDAE